MKYWYVSVALPFVGAIAILIRFFNDSTRTANVVFSLVFAWVFLVL